MSAEPVPAGRALLTLACLVVVIAGLKAAENVLVPLVFSAFIGVLTGPGVVAMQRRGVPPVVSIPLVVIVMLAALVGLASFMGSAVNGFVAALPRYQAGLEDQVAGLTALAQQRGLAFSRQGVLSAIDPSAVMGVVSGTLTQVASLLSNTLLVALTVIFVLFEAIELPRKIRAAMGNPNADLSRFGRIAHDVKDYLVIKTWVSLLTGGIVSLMLWLLKVDFPLLWGLVAFLLNYVPNVGSIIAAVPPVLLAMVQYGLGHAGIVLGGFVAINMVIGNVVEPKWLGQRLGMSTLVVFLSLILWGWLWGAAGMLLSVPLTMVVKILLSHSERWKWVAVMMDAAPPEKIAATKAG